MQQTRLLYIKDVDGGLYEYNVDTKMCRTIKLGCKVDEVASLGGIDMGVGYTFRSDNDKKIYPANELSLFAQQPEAE